MSRLKNLFRRRQDLTHDLKSVAEVAGDQIAPGAGMLLWIVAGAAIGAAGAYYLGQKRKNKKAAGNPAALSNSADTAKGNKGP